VQWLAEICIRRPVFAVMLILALVVAGIAAYLRLGVDRFPKMDMPTVYVSTVYPNAAAEEVESEVTQVLEDSVATVGGIDELRSISREGVSLLLLTFQVHRDIDSATQDVRDAVSAVLNRLPPSVYPPVVRKQDLEASPILTLALSGNRQPRELFLLADRYVKDLIESAPGVGQVAIYGAQDRAVRIEVEAARLAAYRLSILQVRDALVRQNADIPGGRVDAGTRELGLRTLGRFREPRDFLEMVVATPGGTPVRLRDLGNAVDATKEVRNLARLDGRPAVVLSVQRQSGENTVDVIQAVKQRLQRSQKILPPDVRIEVIQDQSRYILAAMHEIQKHLIVGSLLATLVVLIFMRSWRSTIIAAVAIPASLIATFAMMRALDFTLNNMTMLAMVLMVGIVIDDAIVVLENVFHCIEEKGMPPMQAAVVGTKEIGLAVLVTTLSLVIVFLPLAFLSSLAGRMLFQFGMTATVSILVSLLVSFTLTPMMCSRLLKPARTTEGGPASRRGFYHWIEVGYLAVLGWSLRWRWAVLLLSLAVIAANWPLYKLVKQDYIPTNVDESEFEVEVVAREGTSLSSMDQLVRAVEAELSELPGVQLLLTNLGSGGLPRVNASVIYVRLQDLEQRVFSWGRLWRATLAGRPGTAFEGNFTQREKMQEARAIVTRYRHQFAELDLDCAVRNLTSFRQGAPVDIDLSITGPNLDELADFSRRLRDRLQGTPTEPGIPGVVDAYYTLKAKPELHVEIDRERAASLGIDVEEIAGTLRIAVGGDDRASRWQDPEWGDVYDVELRLVGVDRGSPEAISQLYVRTRSPPPPTTAQTTATQTAATSDGQREATLPGLTRLDNVVRLFDVNRFARIDRLDRQRMVAVRANIAPGYALSDRIQAVQEAANQLGMPPAYATRVLGRGRELERTLAEFRWTFVLSFIFMYLLLAAQFEHIVHPLTILFSLPLAVPFGLVSLWLGGESLNVYSALGILVLFGVVKKASILQVDHMNQLRAGGLDREAAIMRGNRDRLRPILMTTIAFVAGMLPLLLGTGPGAEERRSIAVLAVGGQTLSLLLTLVAVPVVYSFLDDLGASFGRGRTASADVDRG
jgi:hydrophobic/amphiphilic exporter-1 (mainly G- bacteria), HAE1 family